MNDGKYSFWSIKNPSKVGNELEEIASKDRNE